MPRELFIQTEQGFAAGLALNFTVPLDETGQSARAAVDDAVAVIESHRARQFLLEALVDLAARYERLKDIPAEKIVAETARLRELVAIRAGWKREHDARRNRADFEEGPQQRVAIAKFDEDTREMLRKFDEEAESHKKAIPVLEKRAELQRRVLRGESLVALMEARVKEVGAAD